MKDDSEITPGPALPVDESVEDLLAQPEYPQPGDDSQPPNQGREKS
ncbi:MAG: hypothetical protein KF760_33755 [Candidatus Eremiobacteraeota bacterium]|nr:hypothetical protein [Candidatus Eremiobacteraeota bacterium]MCW5869868.1 hypothetical protein [Candidatus Eremiobacteraeota bacterium]